MRARFLGESDPFTLTHGKEYEVVSVELNWYRIVDETDEDYLYPADLFEVTATEPPAPVYDEAALNAMTARGESPCVVETEVESDAPTMSDIPAEEFYEPPAIKSA